MAMAVGITRKIEPAIPQLSSVEDIKKEIQSIITQPSSGESKKDVQPVISQPSSGNKSSKLGFLLKFALCSLVVVASICLLYFVIWVMIPYILTLSIIKAILGGIFAAVTMPSIPIGAIISCIVIIMSVDKLLKTKKQTTQEAVETVLEKDLTEKITLDDVVVPGKVKKEVDNIRHSFSRGLKDTETGYIFYGPPGTGKTMLANAIANTVEGVFISITASELISRFINNTSADIHDFFVDAKRRVQEERQKTEKNVPGIIFIDEIDAIGGERTSSDSISSQEHNQSLIGLLKELNGIDPKDNIVVITATNRLESLDTALIRSGRLGNRIFIGHPDQDDRKKILELNMRDVCPEPNLDLEGIASKTGEDSGKVYSGADMKALADGAKTNAENRMEDKKKELEKNLEEDKEKARKDKESLNLTYEEAVKKSEEAFKQAEEQAKNSTEVLRLTKNVEQAKENLKLAKGKYVQNKKNFESAKSTLISKRTELEDLLIKKSNIQRIGEAFEMAKKDLKLAEENAEQKACKSLKEEVIEIMKEINSSKEKAVKHAKKDLKLAEKEAKQAKGTLKEGKEKAEEQAKKALKLAEEEANQCKEIFERIKEAKDVKQVKGTFKLVRIKIRQAEENFKRAEEKCLKDIEEAKAFKKEISNAEKEIEEAKKNKRQAKIELKKWIKEEYIKQLEQDYKDEDKLKLVKELFELDEREDVIQNAEKRLKLLEEAIKSPEKLYPFRCMA
ncbi:AAA family ATPase [Wolbachia endosymbiont of Ctenocephalides felis wCfeT]|uniref:AAA family ATPase n=1 Tax=Wolbachia endosymbiont of Ctenocephalides felis wCfeT TaxID=2732593 RepID=UPI001447D7F3|nr:AAA family ATPase [Wolbachia endosymbiont of Ctenocephalides felis wCfeT]